MNVSRVFVALAMTVLIGFMSVAGAQVATGTPTYTGTIEKIDRENKKVTLRHEEIKPLKLAATSTVFDLKSVSLLGSLKVGDAVLFSVEQDKGVLTITAIEQIA